jgi:(2Fe-2S) ferredoxin
VPPFDKHIFICCNTREAGHPRGCCNPDASDALQKAFKKALAERGVKRVRANKSGCLDQCEKGPSVVVYPDTVWYGKVTEADVNEIVEQHIIGGRPVTRLLMPEPQSNAE